MTVEHEHTIQSLLIGWMDRFDTQDIVSPSSKGVFSFLLAGRIVYGAVVCERKLPNNDIQRLVLATEDSRPKPVVIVVSEGNQLKECIEVNLCLSDECSYLFNAGQLFDPIFITGEQLECKLIECLQQLSAANLPQSP